MDKKQQQNNLNKSENIIKLTVGALILIFSDFNLKLPNLKTTE